MTMTLTDDELEARLRLTYRAVTATTAAVPRALPRAEPRPVRSLRYAVLALAVALVAGLVVVPRLRDTASGSPPSGRHAVVQPPSGFRFERARPYDPTVAGLGPATGDWLQYFRGRYDRFDVFTLRGVMPSLDGFAETEPVLGHTAFLSEDGTTLMWQHEPDLTVAVQLLTTGPTAGSTPGALPDELRAAAVNVSLVSDADWTRLQTRQGFATIRSEAGTIEGTDSLTLERQVVGTLRGGVVECIHPVVDEVDVAAVFCGRSEEESPSIVLIQIGDDRYLLWATGQSIDRADLDGSAVELQVLVDPDTGATYRVAVTEADSSTRHVATAFDAGGGVVASASAAAQP